MSDKELKLSQEEKEDFEELIREVIKANNEVKDPMNGAGVIAKKIMSKVYNDLMKYYYKYFVSKKGEINGTHYPIRSQH